MGDSNIVLAGGSEKGKDVFSREREIFKLTGGIFSRYPDAVSVTPTVKNEKIDILRMSTDLIIPKIKSPVQLKLNLYDLQSRPEFRLSVIENNDRRYQVRVNGKPDDIDKALSGYLESIGLGDHGRVFNSNVGETVGLNADGAIALLSGVTKAQRPRDHSVLTNFTLSQVSPEDILKLIR